MQENQRNNLIQLIKVSPILTPPEREEWQQLLELMNDRQSSELERILQSAQHPTAAVPAPGIALSHILNAPLGGKPQSPPPANTKSAQKPAVPPESSGAARKFSDMLSGMLKEKDLPAPAKKPAAELTQHGMQDLRPHPPLVPIPPKPAPAPAPARIPLETPPSSIVPKASPAPVKISPKAMMGSVPSRAANSLPDAPGLQARMPSEDSPLFHAGLENSEILLNVKLETQRAEQQKRQAMQEKVEALKPELPTLQPKKMAAKLDSLSDVQALTVRAWRTENQEGLKNKLSDFIQRQGYHEVIMKLEHSPLYRAYLETGLKVLKEGITFESLGQSQQTASDLLSRAEFEQFTDMLRQIQSSN